MKNKNRFMILLIIAVFIACLGVGAYSYAKYITKYNSNSSGTIAKWYITLNGEDLNGTKEAEITVLQEKNPHIADGVIAPTSLAFFDIMVDATKTGVDLEYEISVNSPEDNVIRDFAIYKMVDLDTNEEVLATDALLKGDMYVKNPDGTLNENKQINKRIYIQWIDDDSIEGHMTDAEDTAAAEWVDFEQSDGTVVKTKKMGVVNVKIEFRQKKAETE